MASTRPRPWMIVAIIMASASCLQAADDPFLAKPLPPEPLEQAAFRPVRIPAWVESTTGVGYTLSVLDESARKNAVAHGVTISEVGFVDPLFAYYDSKLLKKRNPHVEADRTAKEVARYKALGLRILAVYPPTLQGEVWENHPNWRRIPTDTITIPEVDLRQFPHGGMLCPLGPYGDFFIDVLAEILTLFPDVDAFSFDGLHHGGVCYCRHCRDNYRRETVRAIPPRADLEDSAFRHYQHWADRRLENLVQRMQRRLKTIKPEVALITWSTNAGRFGHFLSLPRNMPARMNLLFDAPDQEFWLDETNRGSTIVPAFANAYIWATTNHRVAFSEPYLMSHGNPYGKDSFPPHEVLRRMMLALTYGASPSIAVIQPPRLRKGIDDALDAVAQRKPWLTHKQPEAWAALLMSDNSRTFGARSSGSVEERYLSHVFGTFRALVEEHQAVTVINDWNLNPDDLARFRVLILPNAMCLDAKQAQAIERFVANGGGLVATLETSLLDEFGDPRTNFLLSNLLGVDYKGLIVDGPPRVEPVDPNFAKALGPDYWSKRKNVFDFQHRIDSVLNTPRLDSAIAQEAVTFKGPALSVRPNHASVTTLGTIKPKAVSANPVEQPAVVSRSFGQGRVVYFAAGFDAAYYSYPYPYQRLLISSAVEWASAGRRPPVVVQAPMCVHTSVFRQKRDGERLLVHLFNDVNTTAFHALPNDDVPLREETLPIHEIKLVFRPDYAIRRAHLEPGGRELNLTRDQRGTTVTVPRLDVHAIVVVELDAD